MGKIVICHAAVRADHAVVQPFSRILRGLAKQPLQKIVDSEIPRIRRRHEIPIPRRAFLAKVLIHFPIGTDLRDMDARLVPMAVVA